MSVAIILTFPIPPLPNIGSPYLYPTFTAIGLAAPSVRRVIADRQQHSSVPTRKQFFEVQISMWSALL